MGGMLSDNCKKWFVAAVAVLFLLAWPRAARAQSASESRAYNAAVQEFLDGIYVLAEKDLADFIRTFPESPRVPEAILYQARAALKQTKFKLAVDLLRTNAVLAGPLVDQYRYRLGEAYLESTNYRAAADAFSVLLGEFPNSNYLLAASYGQALAHFKLKDWRRVTELLQQPTGAFRKEAILRPADEFAVRGILLLAEALVEQKEYRMAEETLSQLVEADLTPEFKWHRQYIGCRIQLAEQHLAEALNDTTNLMTMAAASGQRTLVSESVDLQAGILERLNDLDAAAQVYDRNLAESVPADRARQALLKIVELTLAQDKLTEAARKLESFLTRHPDDSGSDVALLTLGELHLKQHLTRLDTNQIETATNTIPVTNHLQQALANFERIITNYLASPLLGKAQLNKGWGLWADGKIVPSQAAFKAAAEQLPHSEEQAVARFKLGEAQFILKDYTNSLRSFRSVLEDFSDLARVKEALWEQALYQVLRVSIELSDVASASDAMSKILEWYPKSFFGDRSMLLVGQHLASLKKAAEARAIFQQLLARFPESALAPEIELAVARSYVREKDWPVAIGKYEEWLERFSTNDARPQVEFDLAVANHQAGRETNALTLFTSFVAEFPTNQMAPLAQNWVADYYFRQQNFTNAEIQYQLLFQNTNWGPSRLFYQAQMRAGSVAIARQAYGDAEKYFNHLIEDNNCPPEVKAEAYFAKGDTLTWQAPDPGKPFDKFVEAINVFKKIPLLYPTNNLVPRAWGCIGNCHLQLAALDSKHYDEATNAYHKVLAPAAGADISARSQAEVGLALVMEKMAKNRPPPENAASLLDSAFVHYTDLVYGKNLHDGESPDPFWLKEAGLAAGRIAEERKQWEMAINIYSRVLGTLPPLRGFLDQRIKKVADQWRLENN